MAEPPEAAERVRVVVRVRPPNEREQQQDPTSSSLHTLTVDATAGQIYVCKKKTERDLERELRCTYDRVFDEKTQQAEVFEYLRDGVQQVAQGYNCTIFAYGQTGTGKTHTMLGQDLEPHPSTEPPVVESPECSSNWGVIPRAVESLFEELRSINQHGSAGVVHCSYMQIYNNDVFDLLQDNKQRMRDPLAVREMIKGNGKQIYVSGLSEFRVTSLQETLQLLKLGNRNRTIRATEYNEKSSRSHALLQLSTEVESRGLESATTIIRRAKLNLVDLAGSEKWDTDVVMGSERSKELTSINQSLSALGNVISALTNPRRTHIPYRDSKLTRLLQDSLGGNTRTVVIATISPSESAVEETISTLQFADRAKNVMIRVKVNELVDDAILLAQAQREISRLKLLLKQSGSHQQVADLEGQVARLNKEKAALAVENQKLRRTVANLRKVASGPSDTDLKAGSLIAANQQRTVAPQMPSVLRPEPPAPNKQYTRDHERPISASSLQLSQLRLDLRDLGAEKKSKLKSVVFTAFEAESAEDARIQQMAKDQELVLKGIQTERRELERQLELLSGMDANQSHSANHSSVKGDPTTGDDEELCPMCGKNIDDHSDAELDRCIELEMEMMRNQHKEKERSVPTRVPLVSGAAPPDRDQDNQTVKATIASGPQQIRRPLASDPRIRRVSTSAHGKMSPYLTDVVRKPSTPPGKPKTGDAKASVRSSSGEGRSTTIGSSHPSRTRDAPGRPASSDNQTDSDCVPARPQVAIPILRQGHKGLKALKRFHATSPYNNAKLRTGNPEKRGSTSISSTSSPTSLSSLEASAEESSRLLTRIVNSVRDIGLQLNVYKCRYDCWYTCTVVGFDRKRRLHCCQYDCGDKQWQDLSQRKVQVLDRTGEPD